MEGRFLAKRYWNIKNPMGCTVDKDYPDLLNLTIGDPDLTTHSNIIEAAAEDAKRGHTHYTDPGGYKEFIEEIAKFYKDEYKIYLKENEIMASSGGCHGIFLTLQCVLEDDDEVIIPNPYFPMYKSQIELAGGKAVLLDVCEEEDFQINIDKLSKLINRNTKAILLNTPNNPTGVCYSEEKMKQLGRLAVENDFLIISDEVYDAFSYKAPFKPVLKMTELKDRVITVGSFSKDFAMTGWRIGFVIGPNYIINCMKILNESICFAPSSVSQRAAIYALRHRKAIQGDIIEEFRDRVYYAYNRINSIKNLRVLKPSGAIYLFVNIKDTGLSSEEFKIKLLNEKHVKVISGTAFGTMGEGYVRIACTLPIKKLKIAFDRIESFCIEHNKTNIYKELEYLT